MEQPFYKDGLHFSCKQCSHCCRHEPGFVYLSEDDLTNLLECFKMHREDFIKTYCRWVPYYDGSMVLCLKEHSNYDCVLWDGGCTAYGDRPLQCKTYPFWNFIVGDRESWERESKDCPGINQGELHSAQEIEKTASLYSGIVPIRYQFG